LQTSYSRKEFVGPEACAECHFSEFASQKVTAMAHAAHLPIEASQPAFACRLGRYVFRIAPQAGRLTYSVSDGRRTISEPILEVFGSGSIGESYVYIHDRKYYEGRVSYYSAVEGLDITAGQPARVPGSMDEALGRELDFSRVKQCFGCHNTAAVTDGKLNLVEMIPGVTCESCHGPAARHIESVKAGTAITPEIVNPAQMEPAAMNDFCGCCHRTSFQVEKFGAMGPQTVRFQPYRLARSRCWSPRDTRIQCTACHDPHQPLVREAAAYDSNCLACHSKAETSTRSTAPGKVCPVNTRDCVGCHMPKIQLAGNGLTFTDHTIRVRRPGPGSPD
jgi:hypothetical protein